MIEMNTDKPEQEKVEMRCDTALHAFSSLLITNNCANI